jgi:predicted restriction endonuclease
MMNGLSAKAKGQKYERVALTEEQKEAKQDCRATISGIRKMVETVCPKCKRKEHQSLPVEYVQSPLAWRQENRLVILCVGCGAKE